MGACSSDGNPDDGPQFELPQILPRESPICVSRMDVTVGDSRNVPMDFTNRGRQTLVIDSADLTGDTRNAFQIQGLDSMRVEYNDFAIVQMRYTPPEAGWDTATLEIRSNAQNFPLLRVFILGRAIPADLDAGTTDWDAGPKPPEAVGSDGGETCPDPST